MQRYKNVDIQMIEIARCGGNREAMNYGLWGLGKHKWGMG